MNKARSVIGIVFLLIQAAAIFYARFGEARYFCWAPFDSQNEYSIKASINDRPLSQEDVVARYRILFIGLDPHSIQHVKDFITQYETTYGRDDHAQVRLSYKINGIEQEDWYWP